MASPRRFPRCIASLLALSALVTITTPATSRAVTPAEIDAAVQKAKAFLYTQQKPGGHWEIDAQRVGVKHDHMQMQGDTFGGFTALATYALLASGESPKDARIVSAVKFLEDADIVGIYALGLRANVWPYIPPTDKRAKLMSERDARLIIAGMNTGKENPANAGFWDYGNGRGFGLKGSGRIDHSVSQYGVLGLWACAQNDVPIPREVWEKIDSGWKSHQYADGGWSYDGAPPDNKLPSPSMTAAGVATLFITDDMISINRGIDCKGNIINDNIERGLAWMTAHFDRVDNPYALYGVERIGMASGRKYFGDIDWYATGAARLLKSQRADGSWVGGFPGGDNTTAATSFALLFLARGRTPAVFSKLEYDFPSKLDPTKTVEGNWNQRPRDVANFTRWVGYQTEREMSWQVVNLKAAVEDIEDAPVLYISGDQDLKFAPADDAKLREFIQTGGIVIGNADCPVAKKAFVKGFEALGHRLFPKYEFRDLPANHLIFTDQPYLANKWKTPQKLRSLSNGVREMMVLIPEADPSRTWQTHTDFKQDPAFQLGADIFLYAIDKQNIGVKGVSYIIRPDTNLIADRSTKVARLMLGDNPDPEPGAWLRLAALFHNQYHLDVDTVPLKLGDKKLAHCKIAHLTGTGRIILSAETRQQMVDYVNAGGTLVIDAAGGNVDFADSMANELKAAFGVAAEVGLKQPLPLESPLYNLPDAKIAGVSYREIYRRQSVGKLKTPRLNGIQIGKRLAIFYSREDLTAGMVGEPVDGISGYTPQFATDIMRNIVLYAGFGDRPAVNQSAAAAAQEK
ncbi:MAG TPA: DUF4159 domain-containing protein [Tepidisphaeraceae bacterium]|jgi:hypothetical protein|nr:DUF4159 domain-containing protein [Tepidisphaeraceae bacterium]